MRFLVVGGGAREHAIAAALAKANAEILVASSNANPGLQHLATESTRVDPVDKVRIVEFARAHRADAAVIGPEAPLAAGVADALRAANIPTVGPNQTAARIESSKRYCRELLARHGIAAQPKFVIPASVDDVDRAVAELGGAPFVVKPSGLTAGKGVWVQGSDFVEPKEGATYAKSLLVQGGSVLLEEKLDGEEFSQMSFVTDSGIYPMPTVQDFKRAREGNRGGNTGGMGSYSQRDHLLPFLSASARNEALSVMERTVAALRSEGLSYRGILYGGFMLTARGPLLLEYNARFGDPEGINALTLYEEGNFAELLLGVAHGRVDPNLVRFRLRATVVKYLVPPGYGDRPQAGGTLEIDASAIESAGLHVFFGSVEGARPRPGAALELAGDRDRGGGQCHPRGRDPGRGGAQVREGEVLRPARHRHEGGPCPADGAYPPAPRPRRETLPSSLERRTAQRSAVELGVARRDDRVGRLEGAARPPSVK